MLHLSVPTRETFLTHGSIEMLISSSSHKLRRVAAIGFAAIISIGLASCTGAGFGPPEMQQVGTPDLIVGSPSASDSGPVAGVTFTLRATVRNLGDGASAATTLRYYRSTDATITTSDTLVGTDAVAALAAGGKQQRVGRRDRAGDRRNVLLRGVRGPGDGRVGHHQQLRVIRAGNGKSR